MREADKNFLKRKAGVFKALGHPTRLWIVEKLEKGEARVREFVNEIEADFSTVSAHLAILQKAGLIESEKRGREVYYSIKAPCVFKFMRCIEEVIKKDLAENIAMLQAGEPAAEKCKSPCDARS